VTLPIIYFQRAHARNILIQVDMTALEHMTDDDLKAMGIPMVRCLMPSNLGFDLMI